VSAHCAKLENKRPLSADLFILERLVGRFSGKPQASHRNARIERVTYPRYSMLNFRGVKLKSTERARLM
jgi:hypothetical protein